jgi:hypothetical protein
LKIFLCEILWYKCAYKQISYHHHINEWIIYNNKQDVRGKIFWKAFLSMFALDFDINQAYLFSFCVCFVFPVFLWVFLCVEIWKLNNVFQFYTNKHKRKTSKLDWCNKTYPHKEIVHLNTFFNLKFIFLCSSYIRINKNVVNTFCVCFVFHVFLCVEIWKLNNVFQFYTVLNSINCACTFVRPIQWINLSNNICCFYLQKVQEKENK